MVKEKLRVGEIHFVFLANECPEKISELSLEEVHFLAKCELKRKFRSLYQVKVLKVFKEIEECPFKEGKEYLFWEKWIIHGKEVFYKWFSRNGNPSINLKYLERKE